MQTVTSYKRRSTRFLSSTSRSPPCTPSKTANDNPQSSGAATIPSRPTWSKRVTSTPSGKKRRTSSRASTSPARRSSCTSKIMASSRRITLQCPYYVHKALMTLCGLPEDRVRVVQMETGGAFGGKEEYPSMIAGHAALLSIKSGRPVKIVYDRMEDMVATTKRHPSRTRHRTAVSKDGKILGGEIEFTIDGGAYATLSSVVLSRGTIHAGGPYYWPSVRIRAKAVATNSPPHGAFRGFGAPQ